MCWLQTSVITTERANVHFKHWCESVFIMHKIRTKCELKQNWKLGKFRCWAHLNAQILEKRSFLLFSLFVEYLCIGKERKTVSRPPYIYCVVYQAKIEPKVKVKINQSPLYREKIRFGSKLLDVGKLKAFSRRFVIGIVSSSVTL